MLEVIDEEGLQQNAKVRGQPAQGRARASSPRGTRSSATCAAWASCWASSWCGPRDPRARHGRRRPRCSRPRKELGLLLGKGGLDGNVLRIKPPMCITADDVDFALDVLDRAFARVEA